MLKKVIIFFFLCFPLLAWSQSTNDQKYKIHIRKATSNITLDGKIDEEEWQKAEIGANFICAQPTDGNLTCDPTEIRLLFDDKYIYVAAKCYQKKDKYVVQSLRRDYAGGTTDIIGVNFDTFKDKQNGINFTVSPLNIQREGLIANGSELNTDWDNRWFSAVHNNEDFWSVEMAIPFKSLRYKQVEGQNEWLINFTRFNQGLPQTERSSWAQIPRQFNGNNINFSGTLIWDTPPPKGRTNIAVIPYVLGGIERDIVNKKETLKQYNIGGDAKIAVTSALNLDLTFNPDFAQVEVDKQQTNLSRFELLFPERRQFFLENSDLFGTFGAETSNPFFSRRIGLAKDSVGNNVSVPIITGARLTGRLNKKWRVGVMDLQTQSRPDLNIVASNFLATAVQRKVLKRSNLGLIFVNKQNFQLDTNGKSSFLINPNSFNRVAGLDFNFFNSDNSWQGKAYFHHSFSPDNAKNNFTGAIRAIYRTQKWSFVNNMTVIGQGYSAEVGYLPRNNLYRIEPEWSRTFWLENKHLLSFTFGQDADFFWRLTDNKITDYDLSPLYVRFDFQNSSKLNITPIRWDYTYLFSNFDPTNTGGKKLPQGTSYLYKSWKFYYISDARKRFSYNIAGRFGQFFNGILNSVNLTTTYRLQPFAIFSLDINYNEINLPEGYNDRKLLLVGPRFDISLHRNFFITSFVQYNNQINNLNLNARVQWRFAPVSDLFIVYTDNYFAENDPLNQFKAFQIKNRALILKCNYWLNM